MHTVQDKNDPRYSAALDLKSAHTCSLCSLPVPKGKPFIQWKDKGHMLDFHPACMNGLITVERIVNGASTNGR